MLYFKPPGQSSNLVSIESILCFSAIFFVLFHRGNKNTSVINSLRSWDIDPSIEDEDDLFKLKLNYTLT